MTAYAAKMIGAPAPDTESAGSGGWLWLRPLLAGALGVWIVWTFRRWNRRVLARAV
jgi:hypothetical protein